MSTPSDRQPQIAKTDQPAPPSPPFQFGISSMLLITTLAAVVLSVTVMVPGIGIALAVVATPALVRTYMLTRRRRDSDKPVATGEKIVLFMMCLGIATLVALATGAAFFVTCFVSFWGVSAANGGRPALDAGLTIGVILGTFAGLTVLIVLLVKWLARPAKKIEVPKSLDLTTWLDTPPEGDP